MDQRRQNWSEAFSGFDLETARREAQRCIQCPAAPCAKACPLHNDIPAALWLMQKGDAVGAAHVFRQTSNMPEVCGRVCPQEKLCEGACVVDRHGQSLPVRIGKLEQFCADWQRKTEGLSARPVPVDGAPVSVVGAGPAGLAAAEELVNLGHPVTVFDAWPRPGGNLYYAIPSFKLAKSIVEEKIDQLRALGVRFLPNMRLGADVSVRDLWREGFRAIFLAYGASEPVQPGIPGEQLPGVYSAFDFLLEVNRNTTPPLASPPARTLAGLKTIIVGGGDTAVDCARSAIRLGAGAVTCVYRRTEAEMLGSVQDRTLAQEEGVEFHFLAAPSRILGDASASGVEFVRTQLVAANGQRPQPQMMVGSEFALDADSIILAVGYRVAENVVSDTPEIQTDRGRIVTTPSDGRTTMAHVFAGGDAVTGPDLVSTAIAAGRRAARAIHEDAEG